MYLIRSRLELREVVSNATRRFSISIEEGAWVLMAGTVARAARSAKSLILRRNLRPYLTHPTPAARTAAHPSWIFDRRGLNGLAERWPSGRRRRFAKPLYGETCIVGSNPILSAITST